VGHRFGVTSRTVHNWIESGQLRAIRIGGTVRIPQCEVTRVENYAIEEIPARVG